MRGAFRVAWTVVTFLAVEALVCGAAALPVVLLWTHAVLPVESSPARLTAAALAIVPSYVLFAFCLMPVSALARRAMGWETPADASLSIAALDWPLLSWARALAMAHIVRIVAGTAFKATPIWTAYLRLNGARMGRRVYVNSLNVSDHNLLEFGDGVVVGADAHISGHTIESGRLRTGAVRLGSNVTIGIGAIVEIGVVVPSGCQIGALSFVPKHATLEEGGVYAGVPAHRLK
jgi:acetyltransferase-like isoleucine patch superfamily enzyme